MTPRALSQPSPRNRSVREMTTTVRPSSSDPRVLAARESVLRDLDAMDAEED